MDEAGAGSASQIMHIWNFMYPQCHQHAHSPIRADQIITVSYEPIAMPRSAGEENLLVQGVEKLAHEGS